MKVLKTLVIHPYLFAVFPILSLFFRNQKQVALVELVLPVMVFLSLALLLHQAGAYILTNSRKAGIVVSLFMVLLFSYRDVYAKTKEIKISGLALGGDIPLLVAGGMILLAGSFAVKKWKTNLQVVTAYLNVTALILVISSAYNITAFEVRRARVLAATKLIRDYTNPAKSRLPTFAQTGDRPDIYYIILDTYARGDTLKKQFGYDNTQFLSWLEKTGFYLAKKSSTNYTFTQLSLASSLNMEYLGHLGEVPGERSQDPTIPYLMISNNKVARTLKANGYKFIHFSTGWGPTRSNAWADVNYAYLPHVLDEFNRVLLESTALAPFIRPYVKTHARSRILYNFEKLGEVPQIKAPTFTFAHFVIPHQPYLFDREGNPVYVGRFEMGGKVWRYKKPYLEQLIYANKLVKDLLTKILKTSKTPPIIVLQSDHGPSTVVGWENPSDELLNERLNVLNAYYLPKKEGRPVLYDEITPVNSFRTIFNYYFKADYKMLEDRSYFSTKVRPHRFIDVTERLK